MDFPIELKPACHSKCHQLSQCIQAQTIAPCSLLLAWGLSSSLCFSRFLAESPLGRERVIYFDSPFSLSPLSLSPSPLKEFRVQWSFHCVPLCLPASQSKLEKSRNWSQITKLRVSLSNKEVIVAFVYTNISKENVRTNFSQWAPPLLCPRIPPNRKFDFSLSHHKYLNKNRLKTWTQDPSCCWSDFPSLIYWQRKKAEVSRARVNNKKKQATHHVTHFLLYVVNVTAGRGVAVQPSISDYFSRFRRISTAMDIFCWIIHILDSRGGNKNCGASIRLFIGHSSVFLIHPSLSIYCLISQYNRGKSVC